jgi:hypothetical protein
MKNKYGKFQKLIKRLFAAKESFHKEQAKIPFDKKIEMLINLQKLVSSIGQLPKNKQIVWQI